MTVKTSISLTDAQDAYIRGLVADGRYSSVSAVLQRGLLLLQHETETNDAELAALRVLLEERRGGPFIDTEQSGERLETMIARKRADHGLDG